ncbi:hypothetical protein SAMD00019534_032830 [Acytostelium subglobosum LB1]|uniref:hypothetical protein n=1 Tax=Acytostelium subglobosum LB1 TaxID=1410327 RepID=UPI0006447B44|nr:hypothetical protein SAMD00019534_032830 [Acytostelium subglobosum LB1]GAM20108.1 hypothetical protein SAMD00019534_032830 [Acytostelium subglobosum LB1]|eukprot:XP_012756870.1 hypothetical protein SAMD00019534_032830 [Acytostelium subglobosum LB1]
MSWLSPKGITQRKPQHSSQLLSKQLPNDEKSRSFESLPIVNIGQSKDVGSQYSPSTTSTTSTSTTMSAANMSTSTPSLPTVSPWTTSTITSTTSTTAAPTPSPWTSLNPSSPSPPAPPSTFDQTSSPIPIDNGGSGNSNSIRKGSASGSSPSTPQRPNYPPPPVPPRLKSGILSPSPSTSPSTPLGGSPSPMRKAPSSPLPPLPRSMMSNGHVAHPGSGSGNGNGATIHGSPSPPSQLVFTRGQMSSPSLLQHGRASGSPLGSARMGMPKVPGGKNSRKRGVTVAASDDSESRRFIMMGPVQPIRPRSKSVELLASWDYVAWERRDSIDEYVKEQASPYDEMNMADELPMRGPRINGSLSLSRGSSISQRFTAGGDLANGNSTAIGNGQDGAADNTSPSSSPRSTTNQQHQSLSPVIVLTNERSNSMGSIGSNRSNSVVGGLGTSSNSLTFENNEEHKPSVVSGRKEHLLDYLCNKNKLDLPYVYSFLTTFSYFMTPEELFDFLVRRYENNHDGSLKLSTGDDSNDSIRQNVIIVLLVWIDSNYADFQDNEILHQRLLTFCQQQQQNSRALMEAVDKQVVMRSNIDSLFELMRADLQHSPRSISSATSSKSQSQTYAAHQLQDWLVQHLSVGRAAADIVIKNMIIAKKVTPGSSGSSTGKAASGSDASRNKIQRDDVFSIPPVPISKESYSKTFLDHHPHDLAKQLTIIEFGMFQRIKIRELYHKSWTVAKTKFETSPNVMEMINNSNRVANWVATEVVTTPHPKKRVEVLKRFITTAEYCRKINNFNTMMEIVSGLSNCSVRRLKDTWKALPRAYQNSFKQMSDFFSTNENWKLYRSAIKAREFPCLPYLGLFLQDINFLEDGNANNMVQGGGGVIGGETSVIGSSPLSLSAGMDQVVNFKKMTLLSGIFKNLMFFQKHPYLSFTSNSNAQNFLDKDMLILPDKELYAFSKFVESPTNPLNKLTKSKQASVM